MWFQPAGMSLGGMPAIVEPILRRDSSPTGKLEVAVC